MTLCGIRGVYYTVPSFLIAEMGMYKFPDGSM
jgi:hypothetical protein